FLEERKDDIAAMIITHAHEDHVGAVHHLWPRLRCPIYCTPFTAACLMSKFEEAPECKDARISIIKQGDTIKAGPFKASFIPVAHSIPETSSILIETKAGRVLHSADWNLDPAPVVGPKTDGALFQEAAKKGITAYVGDSTNAEVQGYSGSEGDVEKGMAAVFKECEKRIIVTIFSSNIGRIRSIAKAAEANGRSVCVVGRSLHKMIGNAKSCGYLQDITDFVSEEDASHLPDDKTVIIATGSQGEARAQLARIAAGSHPSIKLSAGDSVIFSSRAIPGNEKDIIHVQNNLAASGVNIITPRHTKHIIHVSGHPAQEEIKTMFGWLKPESVVAVHGERTMLEAHARLAKEQGIETAIVPNNGSVIRLAPGPVEIVDHVETGLLAVGPKTVMDADDPSISQRRKLQYAGTVHVTLVVDDRGNLVADPQVSSVGLQDLDTDEGQALHEDILSETEDILADMTRDELRDNAYIAEEVRIGIRRFVMHALRIKPVTSVHVVRV
ncbi:MAG: ribonuclease J, partial [Pseudomonadota bacterium]